MRTFSTAETSAPVPEVPAPVPVLPPVEVLSDVNIVVGQITECQNHPDAESLYVEKIDVGVNNGGIREIVR